jgi:hypothetical protein
MGFVFWLYIITFLLTPFLALIISSYLTPAILKTVIKIGFPIFIIYDASLALLDEGATVPFISRYRKEAYRQLDEVQVAAIRDRVQQLRDLDKRREAILKSLTDMGKLTPELEANKRRRNHGAAGRYLPALSP